MTEHCEPMAARVHPAYSISKTLLDLAVATVVLLLLAPLLLVVAAAVAVDSRGPILFRQRRTGLNGQVFSIYKYRTMRVIEDGDEIRHASKDDDRVTRVGAFLRRTSIDELAQLFNVLKGEMSLVGPRPHALAHDTYYAARLDGYDARFRAKPGITGLAQVEGHRGEIMDLGDMRLRVDLDNAYIDRWSWFLDLKILLRTALLLLSHDPKAY